MGQTIFQVDAFTNTPFSGNPAAVCVLPKARDEQWMQHVAQEMNLSETAFLLRQADGSSGFNLRWFTPAVEVDLCGHSTLASAQVFGTIGVGVLALILFVWVEAHSRAPMMSLSLFSSPNFVRANVLTFLLYSSLTRFSGRQPARFSTPVSMC